MKERLRFWASREGWDDLVAGVARPVLVLALLLFAYLALRAAPGGHLEFEHRILLAFRQASDPTVAIGPSWLPSAVRDITALGSTVVLCGVVLAVATLLLLRRRTTTAVEILATTAGGIALGHWLKLGFGRPRPEVLPHLTEVTSMSFPSGHSLSSTVVYLTLGALLGRTVERRREKLYFFGSAVVLTVLIGLSRVYLGVHYPSDVLAGWAVGATWVLACWFLFNRLERRSPARGA